MVFIFDRDLARDVLATERFIRRQPGVGGAAGFILVGLPLYGEQIERVLAEFVAGIAIEFIRASRPSVAKRDNVINLNRAGSILAALKFHGRASIWVVENAGLNFAAFDDSVFEVAVENYFARIAAVFVEAPTVVEEFAVILLSGVFVLDGKAFEYIDGFSRIGLGLLAFELDFFRLLDGGIE